MLHKHTVLNERFAFLSGLFLAMVGRADGAIAIRDLPDEYAPGVPLDVRFIFVSPDPPEIWRLVVEDAPPADWRVLYISDGGTWDWIRGVVRWQFPPPVPFPWSWTFWYEVLPPPDTEGKHCFVGYFQVDFEQEQAIVGDGCIQPPPPRGACCYKDETCTPDVLETACLASGGTYLGEESTCHGDPDGDGVVGCADACPTSSAPAGVDPEGRPLGDIDGDCDVDLLDYAILQENLTGPHQ